MVKSLAAVDALPATNQLRLQLGLPLRNQDDLSRLLEELQNPASTNYHRWLTPDEFTTKFGPTDEDYQKVVRYAGSHGFTVVRTHANRMMVSVEAPVASIEQAFQLKLRRYQHPTEKRLFFAPDTEPMIEADVPIMHVAGLDDYIVPHRIGGAPKVVPLITNSIVAYATGSSPGGFFMGKDFRTAFVPGVTNTGAGQYIAVVDVGGPYYPLDVYMYETNAGLSTNIVVTNIITTFTPFWTTPLTGSSVDEGEEVLDIDMSMSMAPGATILNYEGEAHDLFNQIAVDNKAKQMTLSYGFGIDSIIQQIFQEFVAQGQAMSQASGDGGADPDGGTGLTGAPYSTVVGGVSLSTTVAGGPWQSDPAWGGSGGGVSGYGIPTWQEGISMTANQGSPYYRNYPDVAMPADNIFTVFKNGTIIGGTGGTSAASPLWAGFMALVNQQAASLGKPAVGFVNPVIYAIGKGSHTTYASCFHDVTTGNTLGGQNPGKYSAVAGYDLCTGWGTPTGSNTINALVGDETNDFVLNLSRGTFNLISGGSAGGTITMTAMNGLSGTANFSVSNLPPGISLTVSPASTTDTTSFAIATASNTVPGNYPLTISATIGSKTYGLNLEVVISAPVPGSTPVNLAPFYSRAGIFTDGKTFSGGLDNSSFAYSENLLGRTLGWNGVLFNLGPSNAPDVVVCSGQTISLPAGSYDTLQLLATAVNGGQSAQTFVVTYTDNSTAVFTQGFSDWANAQFFSGEATAVSMPYRAAGDGSSPGTTVTVDGYSLGLNPAKTVKSIRLPSNSNVILLSMELAIDAVTVPLGTNCDRAGIYDDGVTFTNPATGGLDGGGAAYSGTLLGGAIFWTNTLFSFAPHNKTNVISAAGQTITLPTGNYSALRMLATGVQGGQSAQSFVVTYANGSMTTFTQGLSDWFSPGTFTGESKAVVMGHRNSSDGTKDNRVFYLYGYTFALNSTNPVKSIKLPSNPNVIVAALSLVPNWPPTFKASPFSLAAATAGVPYSGTISTNASDLNGGTIVYSEASGPGWLTVNANGSVSGQPSATDVGTNSFVVTATDVGGQSGAATLYINVLPSPLIVPVIAVTGTNLTLGWTGGTGPFQVQVSTDLTGSNWVNLGDLTTTNSVPITASNSAAFYRVIGQ